MMKFVQKENLYSKKIKDNWYVLEFDHKAMRELNSVASFIWEIIEKPVTYEDIINKICREFKVKREPAMEDVKRFLAQYVKEGYIKQV